MNDIIIKSISQAREIFWLNPHMTMGFTPDIVEAVTPEDVEDASDRLERFAPMIRKYFPETENGIIESELSDIPHMQELLGINGRLLLKRDSDLKIAGSVKARGGIYEVLKHTEDLAVAAGILKGPEDDHLKLAADAARNYFGRYKIQVGSTGNLGISIGVMGAAVGFDTIVHMSSDAKQWKKDLLRSRGVTVVEYDGDYSQAVANGRRSSEEDRYSYFVDDEHSKDLFLGYAVAAGRLKKQLENRKLTVDDQHPLFVYIPCGVGGAPGGITYGLKLVYGDNVHCFFAEPTQAPCMLLGLASGKYDGICVQDIGLTGKTAADGLAVGRCSGLVSHIMDRLMSGEMTVSDERLDIYKKQLWKSENIFIEPSSCAAFHALKGFCGSSEGRMYMNSHNLESKMNNAVHIVWATGGSMMPLEERNL